MLFKVFSIFSFGGYFVQRSGTILAILVEGHPRNTSVKLLWNHFSNFDRGSFKEHFYEIISNSIL